MGQRKRQQHQQRRGLYEALDRLEPALRQLEGLIDLLRNLAAAEDAIEPTVFEVLAGPLAGSRSEIAESNSQLRQLADAGIPTAFPD